MEIDSEGLYYGEILGQQPQIAPAQSPSSSPGSGLGLTARTGPADVHWPARSCPPRRAQAPLQRLCAPPPPVPVSEPARCTLRPPQVFIDPRLLSWRPSSRTPAAALPVPSLTLLFALAPPSKRPPRRSPAPRGRPCRCSPRAPALCRRVTGYPKTLCFKGARRQAGWWLSPSDPHRGWLECPHGMTADTSERVAQAKQEPQSPL